MSAVHAADLRDRQIIHCPKGFRERQGEDRSPSRKGSKPRAIFSSLERVGHSGLPSTLTRASSTESAMSRASARTIIFSTSSAGKRDAVRPKRMVPRASQLISSGSEDHWSSKRTAKL